MLLQPARNCVGIAPPVLLFSVNLGDLYGAQFLFHIEVVEPVAVLVKSLSSKSFTHRCISRKNPTLVICPKFPFLFCFDGSCFC